MTDEKEKPLTLSELVKYGQEVLFPYMEGTFATKKEFGEFKDEMLEFKDEMTKFEDKALKELGTLTQEKTVGDAQDKRQKKVLQIHNTALKSKGVLSKEQTLEIDKLRVF